MLQKDSNMIEFNRTYSGMVRDAIAIVNIQKYDIVVD